MEIIFEPQKPQITRTRWVDAMSRMHPGAVEVPTNLRDAGNNVRIQFPNGAIAQWKWKSVTPEDALREAQSALLVLAVQVPRPSYRG